MIAPLLVSPSFHPSYRYDLVSGEQLTSEALRALLQQGREVEQGQGQGHAQGHGQGQGQGQGQVLCQQKQAAAGSRQIPGRSSSVSR